MSLSAALQRCCAAQSTVLRQAAARFPGALWGTPLPSPSRRQGELACCASRKKKGSSGGSSKDDGSGSNAHSMQDAIRESRQQQLAATDMLAKLLQEEQPAQQLAVARQHVDSLDEQFFWSANTYLTMAKKEGNADVVSRLEAAIKAAFEAKQATLRPEIQLLNRLLAAETPEARQQVLGAPEAAQQLVMSDRYFFGLLERMQSDVARQPEGQPKAALSEKLAAIRRDAEAAAGSAV